jgi:hypothetical protein
MLKGNVILCVDAAQTNMNRSEINSEETCRNSSRTIFSLSFGLVRGGRSRYLAKASVAMRTEGLRLSSAEAERIVETRLLNQTLKDNVQKKSGENLEIHRKL